MNEDYVVPEALRSYRFVPRESAGSRRPARVSAGAFRARGLPVPDDERRLNIYRLTQERGLDWSPGVDAWTRRRGSEVFGDNLVPLDIDVPMAVDGTALIDTVRWLADRATEAGEFLDLSATLTDRTPGHPESGHLPGWHAWYRVARGQEFRRGALERCRHIELKQRGTCPGSPGYEVRHSVAELPFLPAWIVDLAGKPRPVASRPCGARGHAQERIEGLIDKLLDAGPGDHRRNLLFWSACRAGEMILAGELEAPAAEEMLYRAAESNGLVAKRGAADVRRTIADGLRGAA